MDQSPWKVKTHYLQDIPRTVRNQLRHSSLASSLSFTNLGTLSVITFLYDPPNIIVQFTLRFSKSSRPFRFPYQNSRHLNIKTELL